MQGEMSLLQTLTMVGKQHLYIQTIECENLNIINGNSLYFLGNVSLDSSKLTRSYHLVGASKILQMEVLLPALLQKKCSDLFVLVRKMSKLLVL